MPTMGSAAVSRSAYAGLARRLAVMLVLLGAYRALDWMPLRVLVCDAVAAGLSALGTAVYATTLAGSPVLLASDRGLLFEVTANCTYADLVLVLAAFVWRFGLSTGHNLLRLVCLTAGVFGVNVVRLVLAVQLVVAGASWRLAHDVPDVLIHAVGVGIAVLLALRVDLGSRGEHRSTGAKQALDSPSTECFRQS